MFTGWYLYLDLFIDRAIDFVIAIKLFRAPKNITGKEKKTETRNPKLSKINKPSFIDPFLKASKKFPLTLLPYKQ